MKRLGTRLKTRDICAERYRRATSGQQREPSLLYRVALKGGSEAFFVRLPARLGKKAARNALAERLGTAQRIISFKVAAATEALHEEIGDPLALEDPGLALSAYDLDDAPRPLAAMRRVRGDVWGDSLDAIAGLAVAYAQLRPGWSKPRVAEEAVALAAERGTWLGVSAPVSFGKAVDAVYREMLTPRRHDDPGDTGRTVFVMPAAPSLRLPYPDSRQMLPPDGAVVPDTSYWRRRLADGSVVLDREKIQEKKGEL